MVCAVLAWTVCCIFTFGSFLTTSYERSGISVPRFFCFEFSFAVLKRKIKSCARHEFRVFKMKRRIRLFTTVMVCMAMALCVSCKKNDDSSDSGGGNTGGNEEGIHLGIIGFNDDLYTKDISLLNNSTKYKFKTFINDLTTANGTALYYADYVALENLKSSQEPPKLKNVVLVTFTDGLDNVSIGPSLPNPGNYNTDEEYRNALHDKIKNDIVHGKRITAYTIGLKGLDAQADIETFRANLKKLASDDNNVYEAENMNEALESFAEIAESLHSVSTNSKLMLKVPGGYNSGSLIRFTFDNITDVENSNLYVEGTYTKNSSGLLVENITYHGFKDGATSLTSVGVEGSYYQIVFENLTKANGELLTQTDINRIKLWQKKSDNWVPETEFSPSGSTQVIEEQSSALIMLVLDCTTSLGNDFNNMKNAAQQFVETLCSNSGGGNGGGNGTTVDKTFSVSSSKSVCFSPGNLQYKASTKQWRFAEKQWDYIGEANENISSTYSGWIDLFGWGTGNNPTNPSSYYGDYQSFNDWGDYCGLPAPEGTTGMWRTLTIDEWEYVMFERTTSSGVRYAKAKVNGISGTIVVPDSWSKDIYSLNSTNSSGAYFSTNVISASTWENFFEPAGCVFLPAAGDRNGFDVGHVGSDGVYWSSTPNGSDYAYYLIFYSDRCRVTYLDRIYGFSVRLVALPQN